MSDKYQGKWLQGLIIYDIVERHYVFDCIAFCYQLATINYYHLWLKPVQSAKKDQKSLENTPTLFVLPSSTHAVTVVYTLTFSGLVSLMALV
jgi:hypothetical protein